MNDIEYRELLEELRDIIDETIDLADQAIEEKSTSDKAITEARILLANAATLVEKII